MRHKVLTKRPGYESPPKTPSFHHIHLYLINNLSRAIRPSHLIIFIHIYIILCRHFSGRLSLVANGRRYAQLPIHGRYRVVLPERWPNEPTLATPPRGNCV
jgi:hypothetical protein